MDKWSDLDKEPQHHNEQRRGHVLAESSVWPTTEKHSWKENEIYKLIPVTRQHPVFKFPAWSGSITSPQLWESRKSIDETVREKRFSSWSCQSNYKNRLCNRPDEPLQSYILLAEISWRSIIWMNASVGMPWPAMFTACVVTALAFFVPLLDA